MVNKKEIPSWCLYFFACLIAGICWLQLSTDSYLRGWDSYYYALQIDTWFKKGALKYPDGNLVHLLVTPFKYLGLSAEASLRLWVSLTTFIFLASVARLTQFLKSPASILFIFSWAAISPMLVYISIALPKTFAFLVCFCFVFFYTIRPRTKLFHWTFFAIVCLILHKVAAVYIAPCALYLLYKTWEGGDRKRFYFLCSTLVGVGFLFLLYQILGIHTLHWADFYRLEQMRFVPGVISLISRRSFPLPTKIEMTLGLILMIFVFARYWKYKRILVFPSLLLLPSFCPSFGSIALNFGERFGILFPYFSILSLLYIFRKAEKIKKPTRHITQLTLLLFTLALCIVGNYRLNWGHSPARIRSYQKNNDLICGMGDRSIPMLICGKGFNYFYKYKTGKESFPYEPEDHWDKTKIWRLFIGKNKKELERYIPQGCEEFFLPINPDGNCGRDLIPATLIREDCYVSFRASVTSDQDASLYSYLKSDIFNPYLKRPKFLYKKFRRESKNDPFPACPPSGCPF